MPLQTDEQVGLIKDVTYAVSQTPTRFPEFTEASFTQKKEFLQGEGLRVGKVAGRSGRRTLAQEHAEGTLEVELVTKGMGVLLEACLGASTHTLRAGSVYQSVFTAGTGTAPSYTVQTGLAPAGGGAVLPQTFLGMSVDSWELSVDTAGAVMLSMDMVGKELVTATALASASYAANASLYSFAQAAITIGVNGTDTLTAPSTTVLGSTTPATPAANITKFSLKGDNHLDDGGVVIGGAGKRTRRPEYGLREFTGSLTAELTAATLRDYYLNQSNLQLILTVTSAENIAGSGTFAALQVVLPSVFFEGDVPTANGGDIVTVDIDFTVLDGEVVAQPVYIVLVTADAAL
jgi:hypothetical protein